MYALYAPLKYFAFARNFDSSEGLQNSLIVSHMPKVKSTCK